MNKQSGGFYKILVYIAYSYFILCGGIWFYESYQATKQFNYEAFAVVLVFAAQFYFKHKLANLIIGIICLFMSIIIFLDILHLFLSFKKGDPVTNDVKMLLAFGIVNILMSGILVFSYLMFNKELKD